MLAQFGMSAGGSGFTLAVSVLPEFLMTTATSVEARVPLLERAQVPDEVAALYDKLYVDRGVVPNMFKVFANVPPLVMGIAALLKPLMAEGALVGWYKELIATRVASLNRCEYCISAHRYLATQRGATPEQVASYDSFETGPFTEKEKAGFRYASLLHISGHAIDDAAFTAVGAHFNKQEIIELTAVAAAFEFFPRFNSALRIPVTPLPEAQ
ncbi:MAG: carboxymuconolactone decarboxylase family protein [Terracidiphilus sp.]